MRDAMRNGLLWSLGWSGFVLVVFVIVKLAGVVPDKATWTNGLVLAFRFAIVGFVTGAAFVPLIRFVYHRQRLAQVGTLRFAIIGGCIAGLFVPIFLQTMNVISGDGMVPWRLVLDDALWATCFGAVAAAVSHRLARRSQG